jgi:uncharacterized protein YbjT (DUF2867 family)
MSRKTVLVTGATGLQGGSVARHLLRSGEYNVRCLTRNTQSDNARALQQAGAEVVAGDLNDRTTLQAAMSGCDTVFAVTNWWELFDSAKEIVHGRNLVDAAVDAGIARFLFSTLPSAETISGGKIPVPHLDSKAVMEQYARSRGLNGVYLNVAFYFENFINFQMLQRQPDGSLAFGFPQGDTPLAGVCVEDLGGVVAVVLERFNEFAGKVVGVVGDDAPCSHYADAMTSVLGRKAVYQHIPREVYGKFPFAGAEELANMFEFNRLYIPNRKADLELCRKLYPPMQNFETWLKANRAMFEPLLRSAAAS